MLQDIRMLERKMVEAGLDTVANLEETNYFEFTEVMSAKEAPEQMETLGDLLSSAGLI